MPKADERYCWIKVTDARASPAAAAASRSQSHRSTATVAVTGPAPAPGTGTPYGAPKIAGRPPPLAPKVGHRTSAFHPGTNQGRPPPIAPRAHNVLAGRPPPVPHVIRKKDTLSDRWDWDAGTVFYEGRTPGVEMRVVDGDWAAARDWIASPEGMRWAKNAKALRLMAFKETP